MINIIHREIDKGSKRFNAKGEMNGIHSKFLVITTIQIRA